MSRQSGRKAFNQNRIQVGRTRREGTLIDLSKLHRIDESHGNGWEIHAALGEFLVRWRVEFGFEPGAQPLLNVEGLHGLQIGTAYTEADEPPSPPMTPPVNPPSMPPEQPPMTPPTIPPTKPPEEPPPNPGGSTPGGLQQQDQTESPSDAPQDTDGGSEVPESSTSEEPPGLPTVNSELEPLTATQQEHRRRRAMEQARAILEDYAAKKLRYREDIERLIQDSVYPDLVRSLVTGVRRGQISLTDIGDFSWGSLKAIRVPLHTRTPLVLEGVLHSITVKGKRRSLKLADVVVLSPAYEQEIKRLRSRLDGTVRLQYQSRELGMEIQVQAYDDARLRVTAVATRGLAPRSVWSFNVTYSYQVPLSDEKRAAQLQGVMEALGRQPPEVEVPSD